MAGEDYTSPINGKTYRVPKYEEPADAPVAFKDFADNFPPDGSGPHEHPEYADKGHTHSFPAGGKVLQVVRRNWATERTTTSTSYVDYPFGDLTITPTSDSSAILLIATVALEVRCSAPQSNQTGRVRLVNSKTQSINGAEDMIVGLTGYADTSQTMFQARYPTVLIGHDAPASTSAQVYRIQFRSGEANTTLYARANLTRTTFLALEIGA